MEIKLINVSKSYKSAGQTFIDSLRNINLDINIGSYISFVGPSGSGKSTLLKIITGNLKPNEGDVFWGKKPLSRCSLSFINKTRRSRFGIVFQEVCFIDELEIKDNIIMPLIINYINIRKKTEYYNALIENLNIKYLEKRLPGELSGGERKKVAIARALINSPEILIADEPTANLDDNSAKEVFNIFSNLNNLGLTILIATHDERFGLYCRETYFLSMGKIERFQYMGQSS